MFFSHASSSAVEGGRLTSDKATLFMADWQTSLGLNNVRGGCMTRQHLKVCPQLDEIGRLPHADCLPRRSLRQTPPRGVKPGGWRQGTLLSSEEKEGPG